MLGQIEVLVSLFCLPVLQNQPGNSNPAYANSSKYQQHTVP